MFGQAGCNYYGFMTFFNTIFILNLLMILSLEKYWMIRKPFDRRFNQPKFIAKIVFSCFVESIFLPTLPFTGWSDYTPDSEVGKLSCILNLKTDSPLKTSFTIVNIIFTFILPTLFMTIINRMSLREV